MTTVSPVGLPTITQQPRRYYMKQKLSNPVIPDYRPKKKEETEVTLIFSPCMVCGKTITDGYYSRWGHGGVCSRVCNAIQEEKPKDFGEPMLPYFKRSF